MFSAGVQSVPLNKPIAPSSPPDREREHHAQQAHHSTAELATHIIPIRQHASSLTAERAVESKRNGAPCDAIMNTLEPLYMICCFRPPIFRVTYHTFLFAATLFFFAFLTPTAAPPPSPSSAPSPPSPETPADSAPALAAALNAHPAPPPSSPTVLPGALVSRRHDTAGTAVVVELEGVHEEYRCCGR